MVVTTNIDRIRTLALRRFGKGRDTLYFSLENGSLIEILVGSVADKERMVQLLSAAINQLEGVVEKQKGA